MDTSGTTMERGFAEGEHVVLRPVLESDLAGLAELMAQNPIEALPWTRQRLTKQFKDEKEPGLWSKAHCVKRICAFRRKMSI